MKKMIMGVLVLLLWSIASVVIGATALTKDTLKVGTESTYRPFEFRSEMNELIGYNIDLVEAIGRKMGKKIEWVDMSFEGLIPSLMTHKIDMIGAAMANTPKRQERVAFSDRNNVPTDGTGDDEPSVFVVSPGNEKSNPAEFAGKTIAVQLGTTQDLYVKSMKDVTVKNFQKIDDCLLELIYGRVDAVFVNGPVGYKYTQSKDFIGKTSLCAVTPTNTGSKGSAYAVAKDDPELLAAVNKALAEVKASGEYAELREKWGLDAWRKAVVK